METAQFYCVGCQELKDAVYGHRVFRTGYFRLVYPLGCCLLCASEETTRSAATAGCSGTVLGQPDVPPRSASAPLASATETTSVRPAAAAGCSGTVLGQPDVPPRSAPAQLASATEATSIRPAVAAGCSGTVLGQPDVPPRSASAPLASATEATSVRPAAV